MEHCVHVNVVDKTKKVFCWVTEYSGSKKKPAVCKFHVPFLLSTNGKTGFLISVCDSFSSSNVVHHGSVFIELEKNSVFEKKQIKSKRLVLPTDGRSYYERKEATETPTILFETQNSSVIDKTDNVCVPPDAPIPTEAASMYYMDDKLYPESQRFNGIDLASLERQWMLLFPLTLVPGQAGIPLNLKVCYRYAIECLGECEKYCTHHKIDTLEEKARVFGGILSTVLVYKNERTDDTKPAQIFGGQEDCDGMSISAAGMYHAAKKIPSKYLTPSGKSFVNFLKKKEIHLVAGVAGKTPDHNEPHMWVMLYQKGHRPVFCEATSVQKEQSHFKIAAYSWTETNCFIFCETRDSNGKARIGIMERGMGHLQQITKPEKFPSKYLLKMPVHSSLKKDISRFCHFVLDEPDDASPGTGGRFSKYVRGSGFRDGQKFHSLGH